MAKKKNLSDHTQTQVPDGSEMTISIIVADWNPEVTHTLCDGAVKTLKKHGVLEENILVSHVPGAWELIHAAKQVEQFQLPDAIICIGCVIQGDTPHFDYICQGVTQGLAKINTECETPVIYGVLTVNSMEQAMDRAGGKHGNKGDEAAITALVMADLNAKLRAQFEESLGDIEDFNISDEDLNFLDN